MCIMFLIFDLSNNSKLCNSMSKTKENPEGTTPLKVTPKNTKELPKVTHFVCTVADVNEFGNAIDALVPNKYVQQAVFNALNIMLKPISKT